MRQVITLQEVADYLRVTPKTISRLLKAGDIPASRVGRQWRFDKSLIDSWLHQNSSDTSTNILVIDDEESVCALLKDTLEEAGHTVTTVNESSRGLELVKRNEYDLVFLDLKVPIMDGAELFRQIRKFKPDLPVTIITGYPDSELMMKALKHGPLGVIYKPFRSSDILSAINTYIRFGMSMK